jgi:PAS domain S-box-containing protein
MKLPFVTLSRKEYNQLHDETQSLKKETLHATKFIRNIEAGNLQMNQNEQVAQLAEKSEILSALFNMQERLETITQDENQRNWVTQGLAQFVEILRTQDVEASVLYDRIIANLVKYLHANQGGIFIVNQDNKDDIYLEMVACYAYDRKKFLHKRIDSGEGLVGQCYLEADTIYLTDVPANYVNITSGLGSATPCNILIVPLKLNNKIFGVVELAGFHIFEAYQVAFVEKLGESIAATISNIQNTHKTQELLEIAQHQTEEMRAIEEELRQNMEELTATQEETERKSVELNALATAINSTLATVEFDMNGFVLSANPNFLKLMGYQADEVIGKHHRIFLNSDYALSKEYVKFWVDLNCGKAQTGEVKRFNKAGKEVWLSASYTPAIDAKGNPFKVIKFAQNITAQKRLTLDFESQLGAIHKSYLVVEFDPIGNILSANENFLVLMNYELHEIIGRHHRIFVPQEQAHSKEYQDFWEKLAKGEFLNGEFQRKGKNGVEVMIKGSYNPVIDLDGKVYKVVKYAQTLVPKHLQLRVANALTV